MFKLSKSTLSLLIASTISAQAAYSQTTSDAQIDSADDVIYITAELQQTAINNAPVSASVFGESDIKNAQATHLEDLFAQSPNVNFSAGASRGRFIQIRGIGERSQFIEPINSSVGILIDSMDFTGVGNAANTLDVKQVEILRGPQGTLLGANALAGMVNIVSNKPTDELSGNISAGIAEFGEYELSAAVSQQLSETVAGRIALGTLQSDGYYENTYLNRDDTNNIDEKTAKVSLWWTPSDSLDIQANVLHLDSDNGYDAFNFENTYETISDQPGHDRQESTGASMNIDYQLNDTKYIESTISHVQSDTEYGYDDDWSNPEFCLNTECPDGDYSSFDNYQRDNDNSTIDVRLNAEEADLSWTLGVYYKEQEETLLRTYTYAGDFSSEFNTQNAAFYGQLSTEINNGLRLTSGFRFEQRDADYKDTDAINFSPKEDLWGGKLSLEKQLESNTFVYGLISRGYKAGGFNANTVLPEQDRAFSTETLWNYEAGVKTALLDNTLRVNTSIFFQDRDNIQAKQSLVLDRGDGSGAVDFNDYITNASSGKNYGLEMDVFWQLNTTVDIFTTLGLLRAEFSNFDSLTHINAVQDENAPKPFSLDGRDQAHAPNYQYTLGSNFHIDDNFTVSANIEGKDAFYLSNRHEEKSDSYTLLNASASYSIDNLTLSLYGKNLTDEAVITRGFGSFGNNPANGYTTEPYYQFGAPRRFGIKADYSF